MKLCFPTHPSARSKSREHKPPPEVWSQNKSSTAAERNSLRARSKRSSACHIKLFTEHGRGGPEAVARHLTSPPILLVPNHGKVSMLVPRYLVSWNRNPFLSQPRWDRRQCSPCCPRRGFQPGSHESLTTRQSFENGGECWDGRCGDSPFRGRNSHGRGIGWHFGGGGRRGDGSERRRVKEQGGKVILGDEARLWIVTAGLADISSGIVASDELGVRRACNTKTSTRSETNLRSLKGGASHRVESGITGFRRWRGVLLKSRPGLWIPMERGDG